ncbi:putative semaphorin-4D, partial [Triplophysa rosa]
FSLQLTLGSLSPPVHPLPVSCTVSLAVPPHSPVDTSSLPTSCGRPSLLPSSSSSSSSSVWRAHLLPPLLMDQSWGVHPHQAFLLFCLALGPNDVRVQWHVNGRRLETSVMEQRHALSRDAVLVSSWIKEKPSDKPGQYECTAVSKAGNDVSKIDLWPNSMDEAPHRDAVDQWRNALSEHNRLLQEWKKARESCDGHTVL